MSTKISQLTSATDITASDLMQIVDVEDGVMAPSGTNKKATAQLVANNLAKIVNDGAVITANTSTDAVRITQTGSGNALVVEDSTNPDSTPLVVDSNGKLLVGTSTARVNYYGSLTPEGIQDETGTQSLFKNSNNATGPAFYLGKSRGATANSNTVVQDNDQLGAVVFFGADGTNVWPGAQIIAAVDGTPGANDIPGRLVFSTTADGGTSAAERMRITSAGNVGIGTNTPTAKLNVVDNSSSDALRITQTGSGNALVVEDSTNPDATPFVVNDQGQLLIGNSTSLVGPSAFSRGLQVTNQGAQFNAFYNNQFGEGIAFVKTRGTPSSPHTIVQLNDALGAVSFSGSDGSGYVLGSQIASFVDQVPGANDMPTCLTFATTPDGSATCTERMRITSAGNVGIGTAAPSSKLHVAGDLTMSSATVATSATAGTNGDVPAQVAGYLVVSINGTARKIPYYA
jgi:hypothetical protein